MSTIIAYLTQLKNIKKFDGRDIYLDRKEIIMTEKEWINLMRNKEKPFKGILNGSYKLCGVKRCAHVNNYGFQCSEPVYFEEDKYCYLHSKIHNGRITIN